MPGPLRFFGPSAGFYGNSLPQTVYYSGTGVFAATGTITAAVTVGAGALVPIAASGTVTVGVTLGAGGLVPMPATGTVATGVTVGATGSWYLPATGGVATSVVLQAQGSALLPATATLDASVSLTAAGAVVWLATASLEAGVVLVAEGTFTHTIYTFTPPTLADGPPIAYRDRSTRGRHEPTVTDEWLVARANPTGSRLMSFFGQRQTGVAIFKMADGTYRSDRPIPGLRLGQAPWPPVPIDQQVNGAIAQAWVYNRLEYDHVQEPAVVIVYYGGTSYTVSEDEAGDLVDAGFEGYVTAEEVTE